MSGTTVLLLPDAREQEDLVRELNLSIRALPGDLYRPPFFRLGYVNSWPHAWGCRALHVSRDWLLAAITAINWEYPVLIVHRDDDEFRWSHCTLGLSYETMPQE